MTALTNRGLALKLAVENATENGVDLLDNDPEVIQNVFALADKFGTYMSGQNEPTVGTTGTNETAVAGPTQTGQDAKDKILAALDGSAGDLGQQVVTLVRQNLNALRSTSYDGVFTEAERQIDTNATYLGRPAADTLRRLVRSAR